MAPQAKQLLDNSSAPNRGFSALKPSGWMGQPQGISSHLPELVAAALCAGSIGGGTSLAAGGLYFKGTAVSRGRRGQLGGAAAGQALVGGP